ncbi:hypothetical protein [uncultured Draconibacterium sp.]|nr:hypothetical protein [uncultured Draconibacterium sp.]
MPANDTIDNYYDLQNPFIDVIGDFVDLSIASLLEELMILGDTIAG